MKCLQKEPRKRYATAKELADDLNRYLMGEPIRARRTPPIERGIKWTRRHPTVATLLALGTLAVYRPAVHRSLVLEPSQGPGTDRRAARGRSCGDETADDLLRAREAISSNDLNQRQEVLSARRAILERENRRGLADLHDRTGQMLGEVEKAPGSRPRPAGRATGEGRGPGALSSLPRSPQGGTVPRHPVHRPHAPDEPRSHPQVGRGGARRLRTPAARGWDWEPGDLPRRSRPSSGPRSGRLLRAAAGPGRRGGHPGPRRKSSVPCGSSRVPTD